MRLALVIYGSLEGHSGGYLYDRRLVEYCRAAGDTVEIISLPWGAYPLLLAQNWSPSLARRLDGLNVDLLLQDELNHPSLLRHNEHWNAAGRAPIVSIVHHLRSNEVHPAPLLPLYRAVERRYLQTIGGFIFNSRTTQGTVQNLLGRAVTGAVAYPGGDQIGPGLALEKIEERIYRQEPAPVRLLFVGSLIPRKGLHTLLKALRALRRNDWSLDIVGGAADKAYASRMLLEAAPLGDKVRFHGRVINGDLRAMFAKSDVLVVPSSYEGFGIVYLEGMACGLPAVATRAGAAGEIIVDGQHGRLAEPENVASLSACLSEMIQDHEARARMSLNARRRFADFPTWEESAATARAYLLGLTVKGA